jgi:hypothetical protein
LRRPLRRSIAVTEWWNQYGLISYSNKGLLDSWYRTARVGSYVLSIFSVSGGDHINCPGHGLAWPPWREAIMACDGLRIVLVASEWPQVRPASGHARPGHGQAMASGWPDDLVLTRAVEVVIRYSKSISFGQKGTRVPGYGRTKFTKFTKFSRPCTPGTGTALTMETLCSWLRGRQCFI